MYDIRNATVEIDDGIEDLCTGDGYTLDDYLDDMLDYREEWDDESEFAAALEDLR